MKKLTNPNITTLRVIPLNQFSLERMRIDINKDCNLAAWVPLPCFFDRHGLSKGVYYFYLTPNVVEAMSKTLDREQQFDSQRRTRLEPQLSPVKELQEPVGTPTETAPINLPQPANDTPGARWSSYLLITLMLLPFLFYLLQPMLQKFIPQGQINPRPVIGPQPSAAELHIPPVAAPTPAKQMLSTRSVPPTLRFSAVSAIHEPQKAVESGLLLPPTLRLLNVSSPLDLVPTQPFVRWEKTEAQVLQAPKQAVQSHSSLATAITDSSQLAAVSSTLRALKLMDTAIDNAKRVAALENKKPGD